MQVNVKISTKSTQQNSLELNSRVNYWGGGRVTRTGTKPAAAAHGVPIAAALNTQVPVDVTSGASVGHEACTHIVL